MRMIRSNILQSLGLQGRFRRSVLMLFYTVALVSSLVTMILFFSAEAQAIMSSPATCYPSQATCTKCIEAEGPRPGRCVKCARIPGCVPVRDIKQRPETSMCYILCLRGRPGGG